MKTTIKQGLFETNSSSIHTITIQKDSTFSIPDEITFKVGEFGWEFETYSDTNYKTSYLFTTLCQLYDSEKLTSEITYITQALEEINVETNVIYPYIDEWYSIDHVGDLGAFIDDLLKDKQLLYSYLFNPNSIIGNDNSEIEVGPEDEDLPNFYYFYKGN